MKLRLIKVEQAHRYKLVDSRKLEKCDYVLLENGDPVRYFTREQVFTNQAPK